MKIPSLKKISKELTEEQKEALNNLQEATA